MIEGWIFFWISCFDLFQNGNIPQLFWDLNYQLTFQNQMSCLAPLGVWIRAVVWWVTQIWWGWSASPIPFPYCSSDSNTGQFFCRGLWFSHGYWLSWLRDLGLLLTVWDWERDRLQGISPREQAEFYFIHLPVFDSDFGCSWYKRDWKVMKYLGGKKPSAI